MVELPDENQQWYPQVDQEQQDLVDKQQRDVVASLPVIQEVLDWFDARLTDYANPLKFGAVSPNTDAEQCKEALLFGQTVMQDYKQKREQFADDFSKYITEVADGA